MPLPLDLKALVTVKGDKHTQYWEREQTAGGVLLIPVVDGIPRVAEFIHVASSEIVRTTSAEKSPGYGTSSVLPAAE